MGNKKFTARTPEDLESIEQELTSEFDFSRNELGVDHKVFDLDVHGEGETVKILGYKTGTLMVQAGEDNSFKQKVNAKLRTLNVKEENPPEITKKEEQIEKQIFLGFDESGKGEVIGSLFLGCAVLEESAVENWGERLEDVNAKNLSLDDLAYWTEQIHEDTNVETFINKITPLEIDYSGISINRLMDFGYRDVLKRERGRIAESCIIMDNYQIGDALTQEFDSWSEKGAEVKVESKADENYVSAKIASIVARYERKQEVEEIIEANKLEYEGESYELKDGSNSSEIEDWLVAFRSKYPYRRFPYFVRSTWSNVQNIEDQYPRKTTPSNIECNCGERSKLIYAVKGNSVDLKCPHCGSNLDPSILEEHDLVIPDTSSIVRRMFSADISDKGYVEGLTIMVPKKIQQEIDSLGDNPRKGANNELEALSKKDEQGLIRMVKAHTSFRSQDFLSDSIRDRKIISEVVKEDNAILVTADDAMASTATGCFRIHLVDSQKWEDRKYDLLLS